jgi:hypothetical protein
MTEWEKRICFELWRQDDNGNRFLVGAFPTKAGAEKLLCDLTRNPHKQTYWISGNGDGNEEGDNPLH